MRRVEHKRLIRRDQAIHRVWEIELCEVGGRYVVNVRQGPIAGEIRESSLTPEATTEARAREIFARAVADQEHDVSRPTVRPVAEHLVTRIRQGHHNKDLGRTVWQAGRRRVREAEPALLELLGQKQEPLLLYSIVWALARCGSERALPALEAVRGSPQLRDLVAEAVRALTPASGRARLVAAETAALPEAMRRAMAQGAEALERELDRALVDDFVVKGSKDRPRPADALVRLYRIDDDTTRPVVLSTLRRLAFGSPHWWAIRRIFKAAELRGDGEVFGRIAYRIETTPANRGWFGPDTRRYLRRRIARALRKLGQIGSPEYVAMASGVVLPFTDDDAVPTRRSTSYDGEPVAWDGFAPYLGFNQVLHVAGPRYQADRHGKTWRLKPGVAAGAAVIAREEGFPALWDAQPDALVALLIASRCGPVHAVAARALRDQHEVCDRLDDEAVASFLGSGYDVTRRLGLAIAKRRPLAARLLRALVDCALDEARAHLRQWLDQHRTLEVHDTALLALLVVSRHADHRGWIATHLRGLSIGDEVARVLVGRIIAEVRQLGDTADDDARARDAAATLLRLYARTLATIGADVIRDLLAHPLAAVQELAADLIAGHATLSQAVPDDLLLALLDSPHPAVRVIGARLLGHLTDEVLARHPELLVALSLHAGGDLRGAVRPVIARIVASDAGIAAGFGPALAQLLRERLLTPLPEGVPAHVVSLLRHELREHLGATSKDEVLRLLGALSPHAQELGGLLLETLDADELTLAEIVKLASHEVLGVRQASWALAARSVPRFRLAMPALAKLLDAKWEDSRQAAFALLREAFTPADYTPAMLVTICDSVRPDVQRFGRDLIASHFRDEDGAEYLVRLAEHPERAVQLFVTNYLERFAAGDAGRLAQLEPYFLAVLSRVNQGAIAKRRCLAFLVAEATTSAAAAAVVASILGRLSATASVRDRAAALRGMVAIRAAFPAIELPITVVEVERRAV